jgi:hypothetical protein
MEFHARLRRSSPLGLLVLDRGESSPLASARSRRRVRGRLALLGRPGGEPAPWLSRLLAPRSSVDRAAVLFDSDGHRSKSSSVNPAAVRTASTSRRAQEGKESEDPQLNGLSPSGGTATNYPLLPR